MQVGVSLPASQTVTDKLIREVSVGGCSSSKLLPVSPDGLQGDGNVR